MTTMLGVSLAGRDVLLVGGGSVTARRLRRFLADGAACRIVAPEVSAPVRELIARHGLAWTPRAVRRSDLEEAWLVHTATGDPAVDGAVAAWCDAAHVFCVNTSTATHGSARLAAETRADDVIVGVVSDAGADPRRSARVRDAVAGLLHEGRLPLRRRRAA
ncbi:MAG: NAD(P)-dependent oxidoreductase, partial [Microbacterium sp.]|uniref:precorrin-2 dehydrogenase/sirohydrochlorin ferrochelatase family protein n=1 Tax=Microbacterium sp. TaxID=51671 RepID=UPI0039E58DB5